MQAWINRGLVLCALFISASGCGPAGAKRYELSGKITWAGRPIPAGLIYFDPDIAGGVDGPQGYAIIEKGQYDTRKGGGGHGGGKYLIRLVALDGVPGPEAALGRPLFPEYSWPEDLPEADGQKDFDIPADVKSRVRQ
jgi:hypothetical protein